jgi:hypothetical protein
MGVLEGDSHRRVRSVASSALSMRKMDQLRPLIRHLANALLDKKIGCGELEVNADFASRVPKVVMHAGQFVFSKQLLRTSFRRSAVGTPRTSGNGELIHLMQNDGFTGKASYSFSSYSVVLGAVAGDEVKSRQVGSHCPKPRHTTATNSGLAQARWSPRTA